MTHEEKTAAIGVAVEQMQSDLELGWTVVVAMESNGDRNAIARIVTGDPDDVESALMLAAALNTVVGMLRAYGGAK